MGIICPTVLAGTVEDYQDQLHTIIPFSHRIQVDLGDGYFTSGTIAIDEVWLPEAISVDIHLMYQEPLKAIAQLAALKPRLIIVHAEADDVLQAVKTIRQLGIDVGIALLQDTTVESARQLIELSDHVLIFSGSLGRFGGTADISLLAKVRQIRAIKQTVEIGWDGGANGTNVRQLSDGGIDIINVGSAIARANNPKNAYHQLVQQVL